MEKFDTSKEALEELGIVLTDEQYSDLFMINLMMVGSTGKKSPIYCILLILKTLGLIPSELKNDISNNEAADDSEKKSNYEFQKRFGRSKNDNKSKHLFDKTNILRAGECVNGKWEEVRRSDSSKRVEYL